MTNAVKQSIQSATSTASNFTLPINWTSFGGGDSSTTVIMFPSNWMKSTFGNDVTTIWYNAIVSAGLVVFGMIIWTVI
jgi:hypothetical protein